MTAVLARVKLALQFQRKETQQQKTSSGRNTKQPRAFAPPGLLLLPRHTKVVTAHDSRKEDQRGNRGRKIEFIQRLKLPLLTGVWPTRAIVPYTGRLAALR